MTVERAKTPAIGWDHNAAMCERLRTEEEAPAGKLKASTVHTRTTSAEVVTRATCKFCGHRGVRLTLATVWQALKYSYVGEPGQYYIGTCPACQMRDCHHVSETEEAVRSRRAHRDEPCVAGMSALLKFNACAHVCEYVPTDEWEDGARVLRCICGDADLDPDDHPPEGRCQKCGGEIGEYDEVTSLGSTYATGWMVLACQACDVEYERRRVRA